MLSAVVFPHPDSAADADGWLIGRSADTWLANLPDHTRIVEAAILE
jgi:hypothetical protein